MKKYIIKIPNTIAIFFCTNLKIITFIFKNSKKKRVSIKIKTKIFLSKKKSTIIFTNIPLILTSNKLKNKNLNSNIRLIKNSLFTKLTKKTLKLVGVGYKAYIITKKIGLFLNLQLGYSHLLYFKIPKNLKIICLKPTIIIFLGKCYKTVNETVAIIRSYKSPEPYKGKGILYKNEKITLKPGKIA